MSDDLQRLATACIFPGFEGPTVPDWVRRRLAEGLGGVVLYAWNVENREQLAALAADLRAEREDVLIAIDEEGGDVTRLEATTGSSYPGNAALGAVDDVALTEDVAAAMGADLAEVSVNLNLAPVADVNTNPLNPVIGIRAFGAEPDLVARHVAAFVRGLQSAGIVACAKHFPGHGDTSVDSHLALPVVDDVGAEALAPFRAAVEADVRAIMTAHIAVRSAGESPATMNPEILRGLLRETLGYDGMVISDALEMGAISASVGVDEGAVQAIAAGVDALCLGHDLFDESVASVRDALVAAVRSGRLAEGRLAEAARRVRATAEWALAHRSRRRVARSVGLDAARRAVRWFGAGNLSRPPLLVELEPEPNMAAGRLAETPVDWLRVAFLDAVTLRVDETTIDTALPLDGRELVIVARDLHRHEWERTAVGALLERAPDALVVEVGLPHWRPPAAVRYVATYGAARVNVEAAAERLYSSPRRGVEQSGSSPGS